MTMDTRLHKGMLTALRRAPKVAAPIVRHGVTRAGQVGVEFEHQGVKAWGRNETAARASWQVSNVGKRYQDGSGTSVGRRHVEKAAAAATPARRPAQQMAKTGAQQSRRALVRSNAMPSIEAAPDPMAAPQQPVAKRKKRPAGSRPGDVADFARRNPSGALAATGAGMVIGGAAAVPLMPLARRAGRTLRHYRNARVMKAGSWKTIDQREQSQRRARRWKNRGIAVATIGGGTLLAASGHHNPNGARNAYRIARRATKDAYPARDGSYRYMVRFGEPGQGVRHTLGARSRYVRGQLKAADTGTKLAAGAFGAAATGTGVAVTGRSVEGYHQRRINTRRRANAQRAITKADRYFDPEDRRQRRLGAYSAGGALVGADQVRRGAQSTFKASRSLTGAKAIGEYLAGHDVKSRGDQKALVVLAHNTERGAMLLNPRAAARIAGGTALIAGAGSVVRRRDKPRHRRWQ